MPNHDSTLKTYATLISPAGVLPLQINKPTPQLVAGYMVGFLPGFVKKSTDFGVLSQFEVFLYGVLRYRVSLCFINLTR